MSAADDRTAADRAAGPESAGAAIRLVAGREIRTRLTSKAFLVTTALLVLSVVLGGVLLNLVGSSGPDSQKVGLTAESAGLEQSIDAAAKATGTDVTTVPVDDPAQGRQQVTDGDLDALVTGTAGDLQVTVDSDLDDGLRAILTSVSQQAALADAVESLGGDPAGVAADIAQAAPQVTVLDPDDTFDPARYVAGLATGILIFITLLTTGQLLAQGVVEEKQSRVVELLLATVRPWHLMTGKVLGIGTIGLLQVALVAGAGAGTAATLGLVDTGSLDVGSVAVWVVVWFVIGFATYAFAIAGAASLVSRQEDVGAVIAPFTALMMIPYIIGVSVAPWSPDSPLVAWISYLPFCGPLLMPIRMAVGGVETWEVVLSLGLSIVAIPVLVWLSSRIYSNAVLRMGARIKVRDALRAA
ncbi:ABC transporter permease [Cellulomonas sp. PhB143]|uniref:ABC transporter permease n=1 Tax=Cellulomonas sp. PhB143 TaxID=2485186 RepID=UPI000F4ACBA5|nr:ABC transporter permease [Cellulomonas sp. PhB143]ROS78693.1 ABC-2 type transport system permease protein [Cellulomonas sp. PhB143]